ncbi:hypothetical protein KIPB_011155 [Kipferlia bialata]|uniref:Uncharacterized protein n=1 Tax=Kipferlia bialata TaxID=797122 RepID=A0A391NWX8_9EUKA|nr:hypothetical protein KIPB_011155 [Kipferlia bialata]|eukprot:g11155.t1
MNVVAVGYDRCIIVTRGVRYHDATAYTDHVYDTLSGEWVHSQESGWIDLMKQDGRKRQISMIGPSTMLCIAHYRFVRDEPTLPPRVMVRDIEEERWGDRVVFGLDDVTMG